MTRPGIDFEFHGDGGARNGPEERPDVRRRNDRAQAGRDLHETEQEHNHQADFLVHREVQFEDNWDGQNKNDDIGSESNRG